MHLLRSAVLAALIATPLAAQQPAPAKPRPRAAASTRASSSVVLDGRVVGSTWFTNAAGVAGPAMITIDYGQPHLRGRALEGSKLLSSPSDSIWRLGANLATHLSTDVDLDLGGTRIPRGRYTLFMRTGASPALIVNRQVGQWGTDYDPSQNVARAPLTLRTSGDTEESLVITLVPAAQGAEGELRISWGRSQWSTPWKVVPPGA